MALSLFSSTIGDVDADSALINRISGGISKIDDVAISTAGAGVLTAAALIAGEIIRTGPVAAFTDTTATAAAIVTALGSFVSGQTFVTRIKNSTIFAETLAAGSGVTLPPTIIIPAKSVATYYGVVGGTRAVPTVTLRHISTTFMARAAGTFTANGATPVTVTDANVSDGSAIIITLKTVGGTVGAVPAVKTITPGTGFTVAGTASDTSVYNYTILG